MVESVGREAVYLAYYLGVQMEQILPYWALGTVAGSLISVFGKERIHSFFVALQDKHLGVLGLIPASILGIASPICMYGTIPLVASFSAKGMRDDWLASFMMSSMLLNPQLIVYSAALGSRALAIRLVSCFLCGIFAGLCVRFFLKGGTFFTFAGFQGPCSRDTDPNPLFRLFKSIGRNIKATGPSFLAGISITAAFQRYVPSRVVAELFGAQRGFGVLMAAALGVPIYVCGGGTIPLIAEWLGSGMSLGSAAAFMITGPATKFTNLGAVKTILGFRNFMIYLAFVAFFAISTGVVVDAFGRG